MKKILAILLILVLSLTYMVSCDKIPGLDKIKLPWQKNEAPAATATLDDAKNYLFSTYKDNAAAPMGDYDLVAKVIIDGTTFNVTWSVSLDTITIKESTKENFWTVDLPEKNETETQYVLTATITDADGNKVEVKFNKTLPVIDSTGVETTLTEGVAYKLYFEQANLGYTLYALNTTQNDQNKFINSTLDPKEAADFYVEVVDGGYKVYTEIDGVKHYLHATATLKTEGNGYTKTIGFATESDCVFSYDSDLRTYLVVLQNEKFGVGTYNAFETISISELKYFKPDNINVAGGQFPVGFMTSEYAETLAPDEKPVVKDPEAGSTLTIAEAIALGKTKVKDQYTEGKYYVTGTVKEIQNTTYGNLVITDGTNDLLIYGTYDATGANRFDAMATQPQVGDTITVFGIIGMYNAPQMKNGWITSQSGSGSGSVTPDPQPTVELEVVDVPVAGVAYKLGLFHGNENADVFFNGQEYSSAQPWYLGYGAAATAVDVYLEAVEGVEGAYRLFFYNGEAKTYIRMYPRDGDATKGTMEMTTSVPAEYYTYNTEYKTLIYTNPDNNAQFYMGSSGTYKSISTSAIQYITSETSYIAHFYAEKVEHTCEFVAGKVVDPTCTEDGYTVYTCALCGATENRDTVAATGHVNTTEEVTPATCVEDGVKKVVCACGEVVSTETLPATGHNFVDGTCANGCGTTEEHVCEFVASDKVVAPTCTDAGYTVYTCTCGLTENRDHVDALGHDYDQSVTAPTCTAAGYTTFSCGICDDTYTEEGDPALGHKDENADYKCDNCSEKLLPEDGTALTIAQALALGKLYTKDSYTTTKYYLTGVITEVQNTTYGNVVISDGTNTILIYGIYDATGKIRYDALPYKPVVGDEITVYGIIGFYNAPQMKNSWMDDVVAHEHNYTATVTDPTCIKEGFTTHTCSICAGSYTDTEVEALGHDFVDGVCSRCNASEGSSAPVTLVKFEFGSNGSAAHVDGNSLGTSKTYTEGTDSLTLTGLSSVYGPAYDAKGNSCIKLGTSSKTGSFSFTVGENVTEVRIYVAKYKANTSKITVNGTAYTLTNNSNDGLYDVIVVDTTTVKTVTFATVSGGVRCMVNAIEFVGTPA